MVLLSAIKRVLWLKALNSAMDWMSYLARIDAETPARARPYPIVPFSGGGDGSGVGGGV
jgi:hypothetical protein